MGILQKRPAAIAIAAAVIVLSSQFGAPRSLSKLCRNVDEQFYTGTGVGTDHTGIYAQLQNACDAANALSSVGTSEQAHVLRQARTQLLDAMDAGDRHEMYEAAEAMFAEAYTFMEALGDQPLSEEDYSYAGSRYDNITGAARVIRDSGFNAAVDALADGALARFPARQLAALTGVDLPERYE